MSGVLEAKRGKGTLSADMPPLPPDPYARAVAGQSRPFDDMRAKVKARIAQAFAAAAESENRGKGGTKRADRELPSAEEFVRASLVALGMSPAKARALFSFADKRAKRTK